MVGSFPSSDASRSHMAVSALIGPSERYSAMPSANQSGGALAVVVVDVEMLGLDDLEIEVGVLDLVPAEVLGGEETWHADEQGEQGRCSASKHGDLSLGGADQQLRCVAPEPLELVERA